MAVNSSSSLNHFYHCSESPVGHFIITAYVVIRCFFLLPLSLFVLYLGHQRCRQQRSFATTSHSDIFSYHFAAVEVIFALGATFYFCGIPSGLPEIMMLGHYLGSIALPGETSFHILAGVERYLAVVHPVIYLRLKQSGGVRIRNISIGCVWLLCFGWIGAIALYHPDPLHIPTVSFLILSLVAVSFCSLSVLHVLIRPGPGEIGAHRAPVDQSKQRAFYTVTAILGLLWLFILGYLVCIFLNNSFVLSFSGECVVFLLINMVTLPSSFILPLLFLHKTGKLLCCHSITE